MNLEKHCIQAVITDGKITSADEPSREKRCGRSAKTTCSLKRAVNEKEDKVQSGPNLSKSSRGGLYCDDLIRPPTMVPLSSHSRTQWGQLGENLGGVKVPEQTARSGFVSRPPSGEVVSNTDGKVISNNSGDRWLHLYVESDPRF